MDAHPSEHLPAITFLPLFNLSLCDVAQATCHGNGNMPLAEISETFSGGLQPGHHFGRPIHRPVLATEMAKEHPDAGGLVLISPLTSVSDVARNNWFLGPMPIPMLLRDKLENLSKIGSVYISLFLTVGTADQLTPPAMARALFQRLGMVEQGVGFIYCSTTPFGVAAVVIPFTGPRPASCAG